MSMFRTAPTNRKPISPNVWAAVCFVIAGLLLVWSAVHLILSWNEYSHTPGTSAPFSLWINTTLIMYVVPAIVLLILGIWQHSKAKHLR